MDNAHLFSDEPRPSGQSETFDALRGDPTASELFDDAKPERSRALPRPTVLASAAALGLGAALLLNSHSLPATLAIAGLLCGALLIWAGRLTTLNPCWLATALVLAETLPYSNLLPVNPESRWWLHYPLLFVFCLPAIPVAWNKGILKDPCFTPFLGYFGWAAVSIVYSLDPMISAGRLLPAVLIFATLAWVALSTDSIVDMRTVLWRFLLGCGVLLCLTAFAAVALPRTVFVEGRDPAVGIYTWVRDMSGIYRFEGVFNTPNEVGSLMLVSVGVALSLWRGATSRQRMALALIILVATTVGVMADSRSPAASLVMGIAAYSVWKYRARGLIICAALAVAGALVYGALGAGAKVGINRNLSTLTGRTAAWRFEVRKISERPLTGYGYDVEGAIFQDPRFPNWDKFWNRGPNTPTHEGYLSIAVGLGVPALLFWLYLMLRPWIALFRREDDPWNLKPLFFFVALPLLVRGLAETGVGEVRGVEGLILYFSWMIAERQRVAGLRATSNGAASSSSTSVDFARLFARAAIGLFALTVLMTVSIPSALASDYRVNGLTTQSRTSAFGAGPYFATLPPHATLPSGQACAAEIPATPETISGNAFFNRARVSAQELAAFAANGYTFEKLSGYAQYARITGNYTGSTDMIMRWAACKYGIDENVVRGQTWQESYWRQWQVGDKRTTRAQCVQDGFSALWNSTISLVDGRKVSCPYCCWTSWSAWQTKVYYEWKTWPMIEDSTAFAAEYRFADTRSCMDGDWAPYFARRPAQPGHNTYAEDIAAYARNPTRSNLDTILWGCMGMHYSGGWYDPAAIKYIADIKGNMAHRRWLTPNIHVSGP